MDQQTTRVRGAFILVRHFARNVVFYRAGSEGKDLVPDGVFWRSVNGNFIDIAVLEWCKLFGDPKAEHYWQKVVTDPPTFESSLLQFIGQSDEALRRYIGEMRAYRDKFVAHLDKERVATVPRLGIAEACAEHLHAYLLKYQLSEMQLDGTPPSYQSEVQFLRKEAADCYAIIRAT